MIRILKAGTLLSVVRAIVLQPSNKDDVIHNRQKLENIGSGLEKLVADGGGLDKTRVASDIESFASFFHQQMDAAKALEKKGEYNYELVILNGLQQGVKDISDKINQEQVRLASENIEQEESLLLSVLMQRQDRPIEEQLEVLKDRSFKDLPVVPMLKSLLAKGDAATPLYQQVAEYLDAHRPAGETKIDEPAAKTKVTSVTHDVVTKKVVPAQQSVSAKKPVPAKKEVKEELAQIATALEKRLKSIEEKHSEILLKQEAEVAALTKSAATRKDTPMGNKFRLLAQAEARKFAKTDSSIQEHIQTLKQAIQAVKAGDLNELATASNQLKAQMEALEVRNQHFLALMQFLDKSQAQDCPYCQADCVDKCHKEGATYTKCLIKCADAGKTPTAMNSSSDSL